MTTNPAFDAQGLTTDVGSVRGIRGMLAVLRLYRAPFAASVAFGITNQALGVAAATLGAYLAVEAIVGRPKDELVPLVFLLLVMIGARGLAHWLETWISHRLAFRIMVDLRTWVYRSFARLAPGALMAKRSGDLVTMAMSDTEALELFYAHTLINAIVAIVVPLGSIVCLAVVQPLLAAVVVPPLALLGAVPFWLRKTAERQGRALRAQVAEISSDIVDSIQGLREVLAFGQGAARAQIVDERTSALARAQLNHHVRAGAELAITNTLVASAMVSVVGVGASLVNQGRLGRVGFPVAVVLAASAFAPIISHIGTTRKLAPSLAAAHRVFSLLASPAPVPDSGAEEPTAIEAHIRFDQVTFTYSGREAPAVEDVTFEICPGETVALVGHSGAGKSTCAHLLLRFWDVSSGAITIGGYDLRDIRQRSLHELVAFVPQDVFLFNASIAENIRLGRPSASAAEIEVVAEAALADHFIHEMRDGYDTVVGERGVRLSGGQRQRLAIARALLQDAPVLVLDESVSMLDVLSEQELVEAVARVRVGRTNLVIAHRLSTILSADRIVVLKDGRVVGIGTHADLIANCPQYRELTRTQWGTPFRYSPDLAPTDAG